MGTNIPLPLAETRFGAPLASRFIPGIGATT